MTANLLQMLLVRTLLVRLLQKALALHRVHSTEEERVWTVRMTTTKVKQEANKELHISYSGKNESQLYKYSKAIKHTSDIKAFLY